MLKTIITLPDGTEISSGKVSANVIQSVTLTQCVNSGEELTLGSTCANALEATLFTPKGGLTIAAGTEVTVHKEDPTGARTQVGIFMLEKPSRPSANTMKVTGYDRVSKLDKDLTVWLSGLAGWPYTLTAFAGMVCSACGLTFKASAVPNGDFLIYQFNRTSVTGRQLMQWLGEICARFCRATADGEIEFAWYTDSGKTISSNGERYYFQNGLTYEDFSTAAIDAVQIRLADSENGALWPAAADGTNSYIITGNPILNSRVTEELEPVLANIKAALAGVSYTPCKVSTPAVMDIHAGNTVQITDKNGKTITAYVMTKTQTGQKETLECTGSRRRDSSSAVNNQSPSGAAAKALDNMTQEQIFLKLTNNGKLQGLFMKDGELYVNASFLAAGLISSADGKIVIDLENSGIPVFNTGISTNGITVRGDQAGATELFSVITALREYYGDYEAIIRMKNAEGNTFCEIRETTSADGLHIGGQMVIKGIGNPNEVVVRAGTFDAGIECHDTEGAAAAQLGIVGSEGILRVDNIDVTGRGNCKWEYISSIGKTVLVQI